MRRFPNGRSAKTCLRGVARYFFSPLVIGSFLIAVLPASAATYYVSSSGNDTNSGTSWELAKQTIQAGINVARGGDIVLVSDGSYAPITIKSGITVRSINGAQNTIIDGGGVKRCVSIDRGVLDGFTITKGYADYGGGVDSYYGVVTNCTINGNSANIYGGGVFAYGGTVGNCTINSNFSYTHGGGLHTWHGLIQNCIISGNSAKGFGGGVTSDGGTNQNCVISSNSSTVGAGATFNDGLMQKCMVSRNTATRDGGGVLVQHGATAKDSTLTENIAYFNGGGAYLGNGLVENCIISGNESYGSAWTSNNYDCGGGIYVLAGGTVRKCAINRNLAYWDGGGAFLIGGLLENCTLEGNEAYSFGGGLSIVTGLVRNCVISGNKAADMGGGVWAMSGTVENCTIAGNAILSDDGSVGVGGGVFVQGGTVRNCIAYYNQDTDVVGPISYSCLSVSTGGVGNITGEPQFVSAGTGYGLTHVMGNYGLQETSPCINVGLNRSWMTNAVDLNGRPRILNSIVDMGAHEGTRDDIIIMQRPMIISNWCVYGSNAASQTIEVWNAGTRAMEYVLSANVNWLLLSPASGTSTGEIDLVSVNYASAGLLPGVYTGIVSITSVEAINSPQVVTVYLLVKVCQTITFPAIASPQLVTGQVGLAATSSSGLPVSFAVASGPGRITGGTNLTFTAAGTVKVVASQAGDTLYYPAPSVTNTVVVERVAQGITFPPIPAQVVTSRVGLVATASSGLRVSFAIASGPGIISGGTNLTFTAAGTVKIVASQAGNTIYYPAPSVTNTVLVEPFTQTITFPAIPDQTVTSQVGLVATASSGLPVSFAVVSGPGKIADGTSLTFTTTGTVQVVASQAGNAIYYPAPSVTNTVLVERVAQTITFPAIPEQVVSSKVGLFATASSGLRVSFAVVSGPGKIFGRTNLSFTATGTVLVVASQAGNTIYYPAPDVTNTVLVEGFAQAITFPAIPDQTVTSRVGLVATASSGLPVSFAVASGPGVISGGTNLSFTTVGQVQVVASQAGDATYKPAPEVTNAVLVERASQLINFPAILETFSPLVKLAATASSGLPVSFAVVSGPGKIFGGTNLMFMAAGTVEVVASQAGDAAYYPAPEVTNTAVFIRIDPTIYVSPTGNDANCGFSWELAKQTIQAGIAVATNGDTVLVADGTYSPITIGQDITVRSVNGAQTTIIDGGGVVRCAYLDTNAVLDGFTVTNGYAPDYGGGVFVSNGTVRNCTISGNTAGWNGGGVIVWNGGMVTNCTISGNTATGYAGGGVLIYFNGTVRNCTVNGNMANGDGGGGVFTWYGGMVENCSINGNTAWGGGGVLAYYGGMVQNCTISGNLAWYGGGAWVEGSLMENCTISGNAAYDQIGGVLLYNGTMRNCTVSGNTAEGGGGGVYVHFSAVKDCTINGNRSFNNIGGVWLYNGIMQNCTVSENIADWDGGGVIVWDGGTVQNCTISSNTALLNGGGTFVFGGTVENCMISGNSSYGYAPTTIKYDCGGGVYVWSGTVRNCLISENMAFWDGGGAFLWGGTLENCTLSGNNAGSFAGGVRIINGAVKNCLISGNSAVDTGGGVQAEGGTVENCTIVGNTIFSEDGSRGVGGGAYILAGTVRNCIVYYNQDTDVIGPISSSCIGTDTAGVGNITNEPQFVSNGSGYGTNHVPGNYRLLQTSPCINAGINQSWMTSAVDLDRQSRILNGIVDMGAYECENGKVTLKFSPGIFSNRCVYGSNAASQSIAIWNLEQTAMEYALAPNVNWLTNAPANGINNGETNLVSIQYASSNLTPGNYAGIISITSDQAWNSPQVVQVDLVVDKLSQVITFPAIPDQTATSRVGLVATASSGLPVSFAVVSGPGVIANGTDLTFTAVGTIHIVASQAGDAIYNPAPDVMQSFNVTKAAAIVILNNLNQIYTGLPRSVTASTVPENLSVELTYDGSSVAPTDAGTYAVAGVVNDSIYEGSANGTLTVAKADQTITNFVPTNGAVLATTSTVGLAAQASSGLLVTNFAVVSGPGVISGLTNLTFTNFGSVSVTVDQAGDHNWNPAPAVTNTFLVERANQAITFPAIPDQIATSRVGLVATASSGLPVGFAVVSGPGVISGGRNLSFTSIGTVQIKASQTGNEIYNPAADVLNSFGVTKATAMVTLGNLNQTYNGTARSVTASTVPEGLTVEITYDGSSFAPVNAGTYTVAGVVNDSIYEGSANGALTVAKADQAIISLTPTNGAVFATTSTVGLAAQASSGLPVTNFTVVSGPGVISGLTNMIFTNAGTVSVTADQAGDHNWNPAPAVTNTFLVERVAQMITFPAISDQIATSRVGLVATASSGLPVSFAVVSGPGIISGGTNLTFTGAGTVKIVASQAGNAIYNLAPEVTISLSITKASAAVTLHNLNQTYNGTPRIVAASTVPAGLMVELTYDGSSMAPMNAGMYVVAGVVNDSIYSGSANGTLTVAKANQTITSFTPTNGAVFATTSTVGLAAQASSGLPVTNFTIVSGPGVISGLTNLIFTNSGLVSVTVDQAGNRNWNPAPTMTNTLLVERVNQTITFPPIPAQVVTSQVSLAATASSGLPVSFAVVSGPGMISEGMNLTFATAGTVYVVASQAGNAIWESATLVTNEVKVTILPVGVIQFAATSIEVDEAGGSITLSVERTGGSYGPVSVGYETADGTALAGSDYTMQSGTLSWADGEATTRTITVFITDDIVDENHETFTVMLSNVHGANSGPANVATVTILDNDEPPRGVLQFAVTSVDVNEDGGSVSLAVTRTGGSYGAANVEYLATAGTAAAGLDYQTTQGSLSWADGNASSKTITVAIADDNLDESDEAFTLTLSNAQGASLGSASSATVTILDNDEPPTEDLNKVDLEVASFKFVPVNLWAGDNPAEIEFDLINAGPGDLVTAGTQLEISFYLSANQTLGDTDDLAIGTKIEALALPAGSQTTVRYPGREHNGDVTIPDGLSGDYYVFVSVRLVSSAGLYDPDGASAMREGPINVSIHPTDEDGSVNKQRSVLNDYDADGQSDITEYNEGSGEWVVQLSASGSAVRFIFGGSGYESVAGDYDGDLRTDPAVHQRQGYAWQIMLSGLGYKTISFDFGAGAKTRGVVADYNADSLADPGLYEEQSGRWYVFLPDELGNYAIASALFGGAGWAPVVGDYDGDGYADPALYEETTGNWLVMLSALGYGVANAAMGGPGYRPVPADYDGDGKTDLAIMDASGGWYYRLSRGGYALSGPDEFGKSGRPVTGDYDGDGKSDPAVVSATGWYFWLSGSAYTRAGPYSLTQP